MEPSGAGARSRSPGEESTEGKEMRIAGSRRRGTGGLAAMSQRLRAPGGCGCARGLAELSLGPAREWVPYSSRGAISGSEAFTQLLHSTVLCTMHTAIEIRTA